MHSFVKAKIYLSAYRLGIKYNSCNAFKIVDPLSLRKNIILTLILSFVQKYQVFLVCIPYFHKFLHKKLMQRKYEKCHLLKHNNRALPTIYSLFKIIS